MLHRGADGAIFSAQEDVKEGELSVRLLPHHELYARVDTVQMVMKAIRCQPGRRGVLSMCHQHISKTMVVYGR